MPVTNQLAPTTSAAATDESSVSQAATPVAMTNAQVLTVVQAQTVPPNAIVTASGVVLTDQNGNPVLSS